jgi:hypothetical protein
VVEAPGIEPPDTSPAGVVDRCENDVTNTTHHGASHRRVSASLTTTDEAIATAAKAAIDDADYGRARALIDLLDARLATGSEAGSLAELQQAEGHQRPPREGHRAYTPFVR